MKCKVYYLRKFDNVKLQYILIKTKEKNCLVLGRGSWAHKYESIGNVVGVISRYASNAVIDSEDDKTITVKHGVVGVTYVILAKKTYEI